MVVLGLTGGIATGKSTVAKIFKDFKVQVFNDDIVANKIINSKRMLKYFKEYFTEAISNDQLDRGKLKNIVLKDINKLKQLEKIVHPLVNLKRKWFVLRNKLFKQKIIIFDCPLLFEAAINKQCDFVVVTTCSIAEQKKRALARGNITEYEFNTILKRQMAAAEKIKRADFVINTENNLTHMVDEAEKILNSVMNNSKNNNYNLK